MSLRSPLDEVLASRAKVALLRALRDSRHGYSARAACRQAGISKAAGTRALGELAGSGIVHISHGGGAEHRYSLNTDHYLVTPWLLQLLDAEAELLRSLVRDLADRTQDSGASVLLYGSVSRGEDGPGSDLDLLVVGDPEQMEAAVSILSRESPWFHERYGRRLSPLAAPICEVAGAFRDEVERDGVLVCGPPLRERRRHASDSP